MINHSLRYLKNFFLSKKAKKNLIQKTRKELHLYWKDPRDKDNSAALYLKEGGLRSKFLVKLIKKHTTSFQNSVLEIGCNVGRNLNYLSHAGYKKLSGIEISTEAVKLMKKSYPVLCKSAKIYNSPVERIIKKLGDSQFDIVFSMAVLQHIHRDSEWIFREMARITKQYIITIEDEHGLTWRHFPRNYKTIFGKLNVVQVEQMNCKHIKGLSKNFMARVFKKRT